MCNGKCKKYDSRLKFNAPDIGSFKLHGWLDAKPSRIEGRGTLIFERLAFLKQYTSLGWTFIASDCDGKQMQSKASCHLKNKRKPIISRPNLDHACGHQIFKYVEICASVRISRREINASNQLSVQSKVSWIFKAGDQPSSRCACEESSIK